MKKHTLKRYLASLLAVLMLISVTGISPAVFADWITPPSLSNSGISLAASKSGENVTLNGSSFEIRIPYNDDGTINFDTLYQKIFDTCVNTSKSTPKTRDKVDIERYASPLVYIKLEGTTDGETYGPIKEGNTYEVKFTYHYGWKNLSSKEATCNITFLGRQELPSVPAMTIDATFNNDLSINYNALRSALWEQIKAQVSLPDSVKNSSVGFEYYYTYDVNEKTLYKNWVPFEGQDGINVGSIHINIPAVSCGSTYKARLNWGGNSEYKEWHPEFNLTIVDGRTATDISFVEDPTVTLAFNESGIDNEAVKAEIWKVVASVDPEAVKSSITVKYDGTDINSNPSYSEGTHTLNFSYAGSADYKAFSKVVSVTFVDNRAVAFTANAQPGSLNMGFVGNEVDVEATKQAVLKQLVSKVSDVELDQIKVEYMPSILGVKTGTYEDFSKLAKTDISAYYITVPTDIRLSYAGDGTHKPFNVEFTDLKFKDNRAAAPFTVNVPKEGVSLVFNDDTSLNYAGIENAIRAIVTSSDENLGVENLTVKYEASTGIYEPLNYDTKTLIGTPFGEGKFKIKLTWGGSSQYKPFEWTGEIEFKDNRIQSVIKYVANASITFNMVGDEMLQAIFNNAVDKEGSTLPEGLTYKDFTYEYKVVTVETSILGNEKVNEKWVSIVGDDGYPNMNADEEDGQTIRISYKGNADYKGCADEGNVKVMKADVKVSVKKLTVMHVGDTELPDNFITLNPNDTRSIDVYTFFVGRNTSKENTVYLMLPESKTKLIEAISKAQKYLGISPTLEEQLQDGMTMGQLRAALDSIVNSELLSSTTAQRIFNRVMERMGYNFTYAQFKSLYDTISQIASLADNLRIAIGSPNHAGIYQAIAVTVSDNYNRAYGTGTVIVLMSWKGVKIQKNDVIDANGGEITVSQANEFKENGGLCVLTKDGTTLDGTYAGNIHYWFTGLNTIYARSEMPTKEGKYLVTASVVGGDFAAVPKTFVFTIVADKDTDTNSET